jgi:hypothetical protein
VTTLAQRRAALAAAIVAQGIPVPDSWGQQQPPYALVFGDSTDFRPSSGGFVTWKFRVTGVVAKATDQMAVSAMDAMSWSLVMAVWGLQGSFTVDGLGSAAVRDIAGALHYTVDLSVSTTVDFA